MVSTEASSLHIVSKSPFANSALADCLRVCGEQAVIVLIEDAVNAALANTEWVLQLKTAAHAVFVLSEDIDARGLTALIETSFTIVDYAGFVQLCCDHTPIVSWH